LLKNAQLVTVTVLELADTAPPVPLKALKLTQFWKVMPDIAMEEPETMKAGPRAGGNLRLQSKTDASREPYTFKNGTLLFTMTLASLNVPFESITLVARLACMAYAMVWHGCATSHSGLSCPFKGSTETETLAHIAP
jgi:hypothetical protein